MEMRADYLQEENSTNTTSDLFPSVLLSTLQPSLSQIDIWPWRIGLYGVGGACIACIGVVCNCITINVLAHYRTLAGTRSSAPLLLISLEVFDTIFLVFELFLENFTYIAQGGLIDNSYRTSITPVYCVAHPVTHMARSCATFTVVLITVERYLVVSWPFSADRLCRPAVAKLALLTVLLGAVFLHSPDFVAFTCQKVWNNATHTEIVSFKRSKFGFSYFYSRVHKTWINLTVSFLIPFAALLTFNTLLLRSLWLNNTSVLNDNNKRRIQKEKKLTVMVVCMTAIFFLCEVFAAVSFILVAGLDKYLQCSSACIRFTAVADIMIMLNAASNFVIYCGSGEKFREVFCQLYLKRPRPRIRGDSSSSRSSLRLYYRLSDLLHGNTRGQRNNQPSIHPTSS